MEIFPPSQEEQIISAPTPKYWYHCRSHPSCGQLRGDDRHFKEEHAVADVAKLRVRCFGPLCVHCGGPPDSQDDEKGAAQTDPPCQEAALQVLAPTGSAVKAAAASATEEEVS